MQSIFVGATAGRQLSRNMIDHGPTLKYGGLVNRLSGVNFFTKALESRV